ncbi:MAG: CYTH domain-containing protein [bacterium]
MGIEIERKFLLKDNTWREHVHKSSRMIQGYLGGDKSSVRIRLSGNNATINIKGMTIGASRAEYEYSIPEHEALEMLETLCGQKIDKIRHYVQIDQHIWEIDEFNGSNAGLIVAEIELSDEQEDFVKPDWVGEEVTEQERYYNVCLLKNPYQQWQPES